MCENVQRERFPVTCRWVLGVAMKDLWSHNRFQTQSLGVYIMILFSSEKYVYPGTINYGVDSD